ncbi:hypothetical protein BDN72DRAFT_450110 [Pluteus cervinus]|uniref:Uncharacterized protein n=1 Tax=Pluteus cervinus TaxID=181527 RepID=A0ACD3BDK7_9AGAR|nr:hypothetical protein BDN72DRAFT_450110 [Pluteus cervinus]
MTLSPSPSLRSSRCTRGQTWNWLPTLPALTFSRFIVLPEYQTFGFSWAEHCSFRFFPCNLLFAIPAIGISPNGLSIILSLHKSARKRKASTLRTYCTYMYPHPPPILVPPSSHHRPYAPLSPTFPSFASHVAPHLNYYIYRGFLLLVLTQLHYTSIHIFRLSRSHPTISPTLIRSNVFRLVQL